MRRGMVMVAALLLSGAPALADSCWMHNGSLVRLVAAGDARSFVYEVPRPGLREIGVKRGTLLFKGKRHGRTYSGIARMFSTECPGAVTEYAVEGPVSGDQTRIVLSGWREVYRACVPTDQPVEDRLVFTYARRC
ncbi:MULTISPECIES: hypothetical protein [unclassified Xanthobacter]|uniref:hypothetical protein n=1 Tax=unclassified Xanthobacter TaxID=2623496 RepID=UPI001EDF4381|nr:MULTISPECIES: hypothetical protein [unclassified Xanthobacter]